MLFIHIQMFELDSWPVNRSTTTRTALAVGAIPAIYSTFRLANKLLDAFRLVKGNVHQHAKRVLPWFNHNYLPKARTTYLGTGASFFAPVALGTRAALNRHNELRRKKRYAIQRKPKGHIVKYFADGSV